MPYIIAVDDEADVLATLQRAVQRDGIDMKLIDISSEAEGVIVEEKPDMVILDIIMPGVDGITICRRLRANSDFVDLPILFLTAKGRTDDVVAGLDAGADDYIIKPFHVSELRARVTALLRRSVKEDRTTSMLKVGELRLDANTHQVKAKTKDVQLTATEYRLLHYLMTNAGEPQSPSILLQDVWEYPDGTGDPDLVRAHVRNLRAKLKKATGERYVQTVHGLGYIVEK